MFAGLFFETFFETFKHCQKKFRLGFSSRRKKTYKKVGTSKLNRRAKLLLSAEAS